jgi:hypothetical protein
MSTTYWETPDPRTPEFLQSPAWRRLRSQVLERWGHQCQRCGRTPQDGIIINVDHIKPRRDFPELALEFDNCQVLCDVCNHGKGNSDGRDWRKEWNGLPPALRARLLLIEDEIAYYAVIGNKLHEIETREYRKAGDWGWARALGLELARKASRLQVIAEAMRNAGKAAGEFRPEEQQLISEVIVAIYGLEMRG